MEEVGIRRSRHKNQDISHRVVSGTKGGLEYDVEEIGSSTGDPQM